LIYLINPERWCYFTGRYSILGREALGKSIIWDIDDLVRTLVLFFSLGSYPVSAFLIKILLSEMPKIVVKVGRKAHTRSMTQEDKRTNPHPASSHSPIKGRSQTPKAHNEKSEVKSTISRVKKGTVKFEDRKFFTVAEDAEILSYMKKNESTLTSRNIAENLAKKIKHSVESIRDRIKRFISRLKPTDEQYILDEGKVGCVTCLFIICQDWDSNKRRTLGFTCISERRTTRRRDPSHISLQRYQG
jgi:hypothetical protein